MASEDERGGLFGGVFVPPAELAVEFEAALGLATPAESEFVAAGAVVMIPTTSPAVRIAALASESFEPTKSGITDASAGGAALINKFTEGVAICCASGVGLCAITWSATALAVGRLATEPASKPRSFRFNSAERTDWPSRLGISAFCGPRLSAMRMRKPTLHARTRRRELRYDAALGNVAAVEALIAHNLQTIIGGDMLGRSRGEAGEFGHAHFASVDGKTHRRQRGDETHDHEDQPIQQSAKNAHKDSFRFQLTSCKPGKRDGLNSAGFALMIAGSVCLARYRGFMHWQMKRTRRSVRRHVRRWRLA